MTRYFFSILFAAVLIPAASFSKSFPAGKDDFRSANIIYVENSQVDSGGELSGGQLYTLNALLDSVKTEDSKFLLYISNGSSPVVEAKDYSKAFDAVSNLYNEPSKNLPETDKDVDALRSQLFRQKFTVKEHVYLHYFLTDHVLNSLANDGLQDLTSLFAREFAYNTSFQGKQVDVFIYCSNQSKKLKIRDLEKLLAFASMSGFTPKVVVHLQMLK